MPTLSKCDPAMGPKVKSCLYDANKIYRLHIVAISRSVNRETRLHLILMLVGLCSAIDLAQSDGLYLQGR